MGVETNEKRQAFACRFPLVEISGIWRLRRHAVWVFPSFFCRKSLCWRRGKTHTFQPD
jgi:hypothetical protein